MDRKLMAVRYINLKMQHATGRDALERAQLISDQEEL